MNNAAQPADLDVLIVGAGLSGIGAACHLQRNCPNRRYGIVEARTASGGTWDLFRYPGIRSDSDMYTLGYAFKPWTNPKSIADGPSILEYIRETAREYDVEDKIQYQTRVVAAAWDSSISRWIVTLRDETTGETHQQRCQFLYMSTGYYNYERGYTPDFPGSDSFKGQVIHAQHWPEDLDYAGKKVVVIGSGATAVTLVPELAKQAATTTMLQRSPTYIASVPSRDPLATRLRNWLPPMAAYQLTRWKRVIQQLWVFNLSRRRPKMVKDYLLQMVREELGPDFDVDTHFTPSYNPWDQRLCAVPDSDMFAAIREGKADVVTDHIAAFNESGIALESGKQLDADIVVLATGLNLLFMGGIALSVDGAEVQPADHFVYRGMMLSDVPNLAQAFGYTNSSWTLKADLTAEYVCRLLNHMSYTRTDAVIARADEDGIEEEPMLDFISGYVQRSIGSFPRQGKHAPWRVYQNYFLDLLSLRYSRLKGNVLEFRKAAGA